MSLGAENSSDSGCSCVRAAYEGDGFYLPQRALLPDDVIAAGLAGMENVLAHRYDTGVPPSSEPDYDPEKLCKINDVHLASTAVRALIQYPAVGEWAAALTGASMVQVWASQLLIKPLGCVTAGNVGWHQDWQYWQFWEPGSELFTAWIALHDIGPDSGPMCFVRNSHKWGFQNQGDFFFTDQKRLCHQIQVPPQCQWLEVPALLPAGGVSYHHCLTYHGSGLNRSQSPRRSFAFHLRTERSMPLPNRDDYYISNLDDEHHCPVIYDAAVSSSGH